MLTFISVIDKSCQKDEGNHRNVTLSISDKTDPPMMCLLGGLSHGTEIDFDVKNAQLMIDFLQKNVIDRG